MKKKVLMDRNITVDLFYERMETLICIVLSPDLDFC